MKRTATKLSGYQGIMMGMAGFNSEMSKARFPRLYFKVSICSVWPRMVLSQRKSWLYMDPKKSFPKENANICTVGLLKAYNIILMNPMADINTEYSYELCDEPVSACLFKLWKMLNLWYAKQIDISLALNHVHLCAPLVSEIVRIFGSTY